LTTTSVGDVVQGIDTVRDLRRGQIIAAARALLAEGGIEALTIAALEERLGFSRGVITYHFDGKEEIVEAVLQSATREIGGMTQARLDAQTGAAERIKVAMRSTVEGYLTHVEAGQILLSFWGRLGRDPRARKINAELYAAYRREIGLLIEEAIRAKTIAKVDVDDLAASIVGIVLGIVTQAYFDKTAIDPIAAINLAADRLLEGLKPKSRR
jgi:TetR/AcrR family transcriptional regulator, fatty acid metabolism regulator protein